jgi:hypothetical protein
MEPDQPQAAPRMTQMQHQRGFVKDDFWPFAIPPACAAAVPLVSPSVRLDPPHDAASGRATFPSPARGETTAIPRGNTTA